MIKPIIMFIMLFVFVANAEVVDCKAKVGLNLLIDVSIDRDSGEMVAITSGGVIYRGKAPYYHSTKTKEDIYHLAISYDQAVEVIFENGSDERIAFCLNKGECALCRKK